MTFFHLLLLVRFASADSSVTIPNRIPSQCEWSEQDVNGGPLRNQIEAWLLRNGRFGNGKRAKMQDLPKPPDLFTKYLDERYDISSSGALTNSKVQAAFVAAFEDLPEQVRTKIGHIQVNNDNSSTCNDNPVDPRYMESALSTLNICTDNSSKLTFAQLKNAFMHELGHLYAHHNQDLDYQQQWLQRSGWSDTGESRCQKLYIQCEVYQFKDDKGNLRRSKPQFVEPSKGFITPYATYSPGEDFAESFAQYRYARDFHDKAQADEKLMGKYEEMEKIFGRSYLSPNSCLTAGPRDAGAASATR